MVHINNYAVQEYINELEEQKEYSIKTYTFIILEEQEKTRQEKIKKQLELLEEKKQLEKRLKQLQLENAPKYNNSMIDYLIKLIQKGGF
jgi:hypothetical protein